MAVYGRLGFGLCKKSCVFSLMANWLAMSSMISIFLY